MFAQPTDLSTETLRHRLAALNRSPLARADVAAERAALVRELMARADAAAPTTTTDPKRN